MILCASNKNEYEFNFVNWWNYLKKKNQYVLKQKALCVNQKSITFDRKTVMTFQHRS